MLYVYTFFNTFSFKIFNKAFPPLYHSCQSGGRVGVKSHCVWCLAISSWFLPDFSCQNFIR